MSLVLRSYSQALGFLIHNASTTFLFQCDVLVIKKYGDGDVDPTFIKQLYVDSARVILDVR